MGDGLRGLVGGMDGLDEGNIHSKGHIFALDENFPR